MSASSPPDLAVSVIYVIYITGIGLLISLFVRPQVAAMMLTVIAATGQSMSKRYTTKMNPDIRRMDGF